MIPLCDLSGDISTAVLLGIFYGKPAGLARRYSGCQVLFTRARPLLGCHEIGYGVGVTRGGRFSPAFVSIT